MVVKYKKGDELMCLGIPLKVVEISPPYAIGELSGVRQRIRIDMLPGVKVGEYVMVHSGFAIERISEKEVNEMLSLFEEMERY